MKSNVIDIELSRTLVRLGLMGQRHRGPYPYSKEQKKRWRWYDKSIK